MNCLWCDEEIHVTIDWTTIAMPPKAQPICDTCAEGVQELTGSRCRKCSRLSTKRVCEDCLWWEEYLHGDDSIEFNYSVFPYSNQMQEIIAKWKYRGDYELGYIFRESFLTHYKTVFAKVKDAVVVPIPLSDERIHERCFNQAKMLAEFLPLETKEVLTRVHGEKQSKKSRHERITSNNPFILQQNLNNPVIIVDDIYTTGTTLRHAAKLLKLHGCPSVYTYTLVRG
ncbi:ComF family protein [Ornithinibacillus contaminans]|uniref:ComF family protein n=1 Tax=Ornithinibacillus contaminans TaxID=694055 RepID=UPI00064DF91E|nr:phosphoribosyltransferase family protein [Ornithinibacillus contaminans]